MPYRLRADVLGAGREVGRSCIIVTWLDASGATAARVMFDCGIHLGSAPSGKYPDFRRWLGLEANAPAAEVGAALNQEITCVLLTHFHLDHVGALPYLVRNLGYTGPVYATPATVELSRLVLGEVAGLDAEHHVDQPSRAVDVVKTILAGQRLTLRLATGDLALTAHRAGHVVGAVMFEVVLGGVTCLYTGDINTNSENLVDALKIPHHLANPKAVNDLANNVVLSFGRSIDLAICECTYAIHHKDSRPSVDRELCHVIGQTAKAGGKILVPCFSVGKAQEIASVITRGLTDYGFLPDDIPVFIGGYLGQKANDLYMKQVEETAHSDLPWHITRWPSCLNEYFSDAFVKSLQLGDEAVSVPFQIAGAETSIKGSRWIDRNDEVARHLKDMALVDVPYENGETLSLQAMLKQTFSGVKLLTDCPEWADDSSAPGIVFASPSMLTGGLSLKLFKQWCDSANNLVIFTGKCVAGTTGALVSNGQKQVNINNVPTNVNCKVRYFPYANHAGHLGLRRFIEQLSPNACMLVHGDEEGVTTFGKILREESGIDAYCPAAVDTLEFEGMSKAAHLMVPVSAFKAQNKDPKNNTKRARMASEETLVLTQTEPIDPDFKQLCLLEGRRMYVVPGAAEALLKPLSLRLVLSDPPVCPDIEEWLQQISAETVEGSEDGELSDEEEGASMEDHVLRARERFKALLNQDQERACGLRRPDVHLIRSCAWIPWVVWHRAVNKLTEQAKLPDLAFYEKDGYSILAILSMELIIVVAGNKRRVKMLSQWWDQLPEKVGSEFEVSTFSNCKLIQSVEEQLSSDEEGEDRSRPGFLTPLTITTSMDALSCIQNTRSTALIEFWTSIIGACQQAAVMPPPPPPPSYSAGAFVAPVASTEVNMDTPVAAKQPPRRPNKRGEPKILSPRSVKKRPSFRQPVDLTEAAAAFDTRQRRPQNNQKGIFDVYNAVRAAEQENPQWIEFGLQQQAAVVAQQAAAQQAAAQPTPPQPPPQLQAPIMSPPQYQAQQTPMPQYVPDYAQLQQQAQMSQAQQQQQHHRHRQQQQQQQMHAHHLHAPYRQPQARTHPTYQPQQPPRPTPAAVNFSYGSMDSITMPTPAPPMAAPAMSHPSVTQTSMAQPMVQAVPQMVQPPPRMIQPSMMQSNIVQRDMMVPVKPPAVPMAPPQQILAPPQPPVSQVPANYVNYHYPAQPRRVQAVNASYGSISFPAVEQPQPPPPVQPPRAVNASWGSPPAQPINWTPAPQSGWNEEEALDDDWQESNRPAHEWHTWEAALGKR